MDAIAIDATVIRRGGGGGLSRQQSEKAK